MLTNFKKNDIVIVTGVTSSSNNKQEKHHVLAKVEESGKYDLFLKKFPAEEYERIFIVSKKRCQKVVIEHVDVTARNVEPKIGNLVLSIQRTLSKSEKVIGRLEKIIDVPGRPKRADIRTSSRLSSVAFDSIIVIEE